MIHFWVNFEHFHSCTKNQKLEAKPTHSWFFSVLDCEASFQFSSNLSTSHHQSISLGMSSKKRTYVEIGSKCLDLSDELWLQIIQFCYGNQLGSIAIDNMFQQLPLVSKYFHQLCIHYVQHIPQDFCAYDGEETMQLIACACRNRVKLSSFKTLQHDGTAIWINAVVHLFKMCNLRELQSLDILKITNADSVFDECLGTSTRLNGIPYSAMKKKINDHHYLHSSLANIFYHKVPPLKKLAITIQRNKWPHSLLEVVSETIEELKLDVFHRHESRITSAEEGEQFIQYLSNTIENMTRLKKLNICIWFPAGLCIQSKTLEEIDVTRFPLYASVAECVCPSLKMITCMHHGDKSAVRPLVPFRRDELKFTPEDVELVNDFSCVNLDCAQVLRRDKTFVGMDVPGACIIRYASFKN